VPKSAPASLTERATPMYGVSFGRSPATLLSWRITLTRDLSKAQRQLRRAEAAFVSRQRVNSRRRGRRPCVVSTASGNFRLSPPSHRPVPCTLVPGSRAAPSPHRSLLQPRVSRTRPLSGEARPHATRQNSGSPPDLFDDQCFWIARSTVFAFASSMRVCCSSPLSGAIDPFVR
jgi:hypothetical protein